METYKDSGLLPEIIRGVEALGFETPTPIQKLSIEHLLENEGDLIAFAQTGTGKTAAFSLPILNQLEADVQHVQAIVLAPTRELCLQIAKDIESYSKFMDVKVTAVYGGSPITTQIRELQAKPQIVVGTPGRTLDLINRRKLRIEDVQFLVLDEADEMLSMGFQDELDAILANTPEEKQTLCFSATMPDGMKKLTQKYLHEPKEISAGKKNISASKVEHELYVVSPKNTYEATRRILDFNPQMYGIVFCRTRRETQSIAEQLVSDGYRAEAIHGDLSQAQRDDVMKRFRNKRLQVMVATDVAARGIDVNELTHVINVNIPDDPEVYVHRSGRTGRAGNSGISIVITHGRNMRKVKTLERIIGKTFEHKIVPSGDAICQIKMGEAIDELVAMEASTTLDPVLLDQAMDKLAHLSKAELIERFLDHETSAILSRYRGARDINETPGRAKEHGKRDNRTGVEAGYKTIVIDLGYRQKVNPSRLMGLINDQMPGQKVKIGKIDMDQSFSRIDIEERFAPEIAAKLQGAKTGSYVVNAYFEEGGAVSTPRRSNSHGGGDRREKRGSWGGNSDRGAKRGNWGGNSDRGEKRSSWGGDSDRSQRRSSWGGDSDRGERRGNWSGGDSDRPKRERVSSFGSDDRRNKSNSRAAGGSGYGGSRDGGYGGRSEGGRREGGYGSRSEGGYGGRSEGSRSEGGFSGRSESRGGAKKFKGTSKFKGAPKRRK
ncbi:MAG: DEAD-box ATP-dependent RNA helicase CshA [Cryomorphaceae bacterium]|nr:MAG: DEAD-box ATP-dependent RNA helicase CshA [Cryomorphaceae bacterium]